MPKDDDIIQDILEDLHKASVALRDRDTPLLKSLSNHAIDRASVKQDDASADLAVLMYSLAKLVERFEGRETASQEIAIDHIQNRIDRAIVLLEQKKLKGYKKVMEVVFEKIHELDEKFSSYIQEVIEKAKISKGFRMVEKGISMSRTAEVFGLLNYDLMNYVGKTITADAEPSAMSTRQRIQVAISLFGVKN